MSDFNLKLTETDLFLYSLSSELAFRKTKDDRLNLLNDIENKTFYFYEKYNPVSDEEIEIVNIKAIADCCRKSLNTLTDEERKEYERLQRTIPEKKFRLPLSFR